MDPPGKGGLVKKIKIDGNFGFLLTPGMKLTVSGRFNWKEGGIWEVDVWDYRIGH
jgi:hypothetical protein